MPDSHLIAPRRGQAGVSLIETMVGLAIGLVVALVMTQVWSSFENQKQRSINSSSALESGMLGLTRIEQVGRNAGANLASNAPIDCTTTYSYYESGATSYTPPAFNGPTALNAPVQLVSGGNGGSDTIYFKTGTDFQGGGTVTLSTAMSDSSSVIDVPNVAGFNSGDIAMVMNGGTCMVIQITNVLTGALKLQHNPGGSTTWNPPVSYQNANGWPAFGAGSKIAKIGTVQLMKFDVDTTSNILRMTDSTDPANVVTSAIAYDVVAIKAQYGISTAPDVADVTSWVDPTAAAGGWNVLDATKIKRIKAIRVAVITRSSKLEGSNITSPCVNSPGSGNSNNGPCAWPDTVANPAPIVDLNTRPNWGANWRRYRYRVFQTIIPLRNVIWANLS